MLGLVGCSSRSVAPQPPAPAGHNEDSTSGREGASSPLSPPKTSPLAECKKDHRPSPWGQGACRGALGIASPKYLLSPEQTKTVTQFTDFPILVADGPTRAAVEASHGSAYLGAHGEVLVLGDHHSLCAPLQLHRDTGMMLVVVEGSLVAMDEIQGAVGATHGARIDAICRIDRTERERE